MARLTLWGMYQYMPSILDQIVLPAGYNKQALIDKIITKCGDLYPYYQVPDRLRHNVASWVQRRSADWERMYNTMYSTYAPIENYDRHENTGRVKNEKSLTEFSGLDESNSHNFTNQNASNTLGVNAYNLTEGFVNREHTAQSQSTDYNIESNSSTNSNASETAGEEEGFESYVHGNIGVTTTQEMILSEIALRRTDLYAIIADEFEKEFIVQYYK